MMEPIDVQVIRSLLDSRLSSIPITVLKETDSTSRQARIAAENGSHGIFLVVGEKQTEGKGTKGRSFYSPEGGAYFTLSIPMDGSEALACLTPAAAVAASRAVDSISDEKSEIKWVNDIYLHNRKVCGILCEASVGKSVRSYIGVGANIYPGDNGFPEQIRDTAACVCNDRDVVQNREKFIACFINAFFSLYNYGDELYNLYLEKLTMIGKEITVIKNWSENPARAVGLNSDFSLEVEYSDGSRESLLCEEVSIRI